MFYIRFYAQLTKYIILLLTVYYGCVFQGEGAAINIDGEEEMNQNETYSLKCFTTSQVEKVTFHWYRNKKSVKGIKNFKVIDNPDEKYESIIDITPQWFDDGAVITCSISKTIDKKSVNRTLNVKHPPHVEIPNVQPEIGKETKFFCIVSANPPAEKIEWYKDETLYVKKRQNFTIPILRKSDRGTYSCRAWNSLGKGIAEALVEPKKKTKGLLIIGIIVGVILLMIICAIGFIYRWYKKIYNHPLDPGLLETLTKKRSVTKAASLCRISSQIEPGVAVFKTESLERDVPTSEELALETKSNTQLNSQTSATQLSVRKKKKKKNNKKQMQNKSPKGNSRGRSKSSRRGTSDHSERSEQSAA